MEKILPESPSTEKKVLGFRVAVIIVQALGKSMVIWYLDPQTISFHVLFCSRHFDGFRVTGLLYRVYGPK